MMSAFTDDEVQFLNALRLRGITMAFIERPIAPFIVSNDPACVGLSNIGRDTIRWSSPSEEASRSALRNMVEPVQIEALD